MTNWRWPWWKETEEEMVVDTNLPHKNSVTLYADDDLLTRAEKLVFLMGFTGAVGDHVLTMYKALKMYQELDLKNDQEVDEPQETDTPNAGPRTLG
jgi:hypothetical protein